MSEGVHGRAVGFVSILAARQPPGIFLNEIACPPPAPVAHAGPTRAVYVAERDRPLGAFAGSRETTMDSSDGELLFLPLFHARMTEESIFDLRSVSWLLPQLGVVLSSREIISRQSFVYVPCLRTYPCSWKQRQ